MRLARVGECERCGAAYEDRSPGANRRFCSDNCRKRTCDHSHRSTCITCGGPMRIGSTWNRADGRGDQCRACYRRESREWAEGRDATIYLMWHDGAGSAEIAAVLDGSTLSIRARISEMRAEGHELPHRRPDSIGQPHLWQPGECGRWAA